LRYRDFKIVEAKQLGRAFNHLEDLVFFYGSAGTLEALEHLKDMASESGSSSIRMKWDGNPQIYWGRAQAGGPLILAGHNGWSKGAVTDSPEAVEDFIANKSGSPKTPEEKVQRDEFARKFAGLYDYFDRATPDDFVGFVYADGLFIGRPEQDNGVFTFCPNPKSQTCYHVRADSELGRRIDSADVMVVGHAFFPEFGMPDSAQEPMQDFSAFDTTSELIVLGPVYNQKPIQIDTSAINLVENFVRKNGNMIDTFLEGAPGLSDLKNIIYTYVNQSAKARKLDRISGQDFSQWLTTSKVSQPKQAKIIELDQQHGGALNAIFQLVIMIQQMKDRVIDQLEGEQGDIWDTNGEGRVRYADPNKQFGNVKLVPRKRWTPS
jgi:hypothetical protein